MKNTNKKHANQIKNKKIIQKKSKTHKKKLFFTSLVPTKSINLAKAVVT